MSLADEIANELRASEEWWTAHMRAKGWTVVAPNCTPVPRSAAEAKAMIDAAEMWLSAHPSPAQLRDQQMAKDIL